MSKFLKTFNSEINRDEYTKVKLSEIAEGKKVTLVGKISKNKLTTSKGDPYIIAKLTTSQGSIVQFVWSNLPLFRFLDTEIEEGNYVGVQCEIEKNKADLNMNIQNISVLDVSNNKAIPSEETLKKELKSRIAKISNQFLRSLIIEVLKHPVVQENMFIAPATEKTSYNYRGGVAHLIIDTMDLAEKTSFALNDNFNQYSLIVDIELLTATAFLCNIGRLFTLKFDNDLIVKTDEGQLENDSIYARDIVSKKIDELLEAKNEEGKPVFNIDKSYINEILHMVSSAKGRPEFGALAIPRSKHAMILNNINNIVYTKGLFENLERESEVTEEKYIRAYDNSRVYYVNKIEE